MGNLGEVEVRLGNNLNEIEIERQKQKTIQKELD